MAVTTTDTAVQVSVELTPKDGVVVEGSSLTVAIHVTALRTATIDRVQVELVRKINYTYGRGNIYGAVFPARERSLETLLTTEVPGPGIMPAGQSRTISATIPVPVDGPASVRGDLIDVGWSVRCALHAANGQVIKRERLIDVQSWGQTSATDIGHAPVGAHLDRLVMEFIALSSRMLEPGTPLTGVLRLRAHEELSNRGVRVQLVRCEEVLHGPGHQAGPVEPGLPDEVGSDADGYRYAESVMATATVARAGALPAGTTVDLPFTVQTPAGLPAPSLSIANLRVHWELRAVVDVPFHRHPRLALDLLAVTASRQPSQPAEPSPLDTD
jgi:hypothetical protein